MRFHVAFLCAALPILILTIPSLAQDIGSPGPEAVKKLYPGKTFSPFAQSSFPSNAYWGDTHLHTSNSLDASLFGNNLPLEDAYRASRGDEVMSATGLPFKLSRPLDWIVIADHAEYLGFGPAVRNGAPNIPADPKGREWYDQMQKGGEEGALAVQDFVYNFTKGTLPPNLTKDYSAGSPVYAAVWDDIAKTADRYNEPGKFTAAAPRPFAATRGAYPWVAI